MNRFVAVSSWPVISRLWSDPVITLIIFAFAAFWSAKFVESGTVPPQFYQGEFAPAVMEACGKGFVLPKQLADIRGLTDFLQLKQASFSCDDIPPEFDQISPNLLQGSSRYLMGAVALNWRLAGVSWGALLPLYALLFGLSSAAVYGVFRLGMSKLGAAILAVLVLLSPLQLNNLPHLRDYAKVPFIIAMVLLLGWLVKYPLGPRKTVMLGVLAGAVLGVGVGFRMDLLIFVPAVLITLTVFTPSGFAKDVAPRIGAIIAFVLTFMAMGWPVLRTLGGGGNTFHVILLGLMSYFDPDLGIKASSVYEWGYRYNDSYTNFFIDSYAQRILNSASIVTLGTKAYDHAGMLYYLEIARNFPADIATRFLASALTILKLGMVQTLVAPALIFACILCIAVSSFRLALFATIAVAYLCGYPSLQFSERHFFHLEFIPLFFIGVLLQIIISNGYIKFLTYRKNGFSIRGATQEHLFSLPNLRGVVGIGMVFAVIAESFFILRSFQQAHAINLLKPYSQLSILPKGFSTLPSIEGTVLLQPHGTIGRPAVDEYPVRTDYWILELDGAACKRDRVPISIHYESVDAYNNSTRSTVLELQGQVRYIFHSYSSSYSFFSGVVIGKNDISCVKNLGRAVGYEKLPLLMNLTFRENWENERLYQTIDL